MQDLVLSTAVFVQTAGMLCIALMLVLNERRSLAFARRLLAAVPVDNLGRPRLVSGRTALAAARLLLTWGLAGVVLAVLTTWYFLAFGYGPATLALYLLFWGLWFLAYRNLASPFHAMGRGGRPARWLVRRANALVFRAHQRMVTGQERWLPRNLALTGAGLLVAGAGLGAMASGLA